jgi:hypothetical protein
LEAHGGYLCRLEGFGDVDLVALAVQALALDGAIPASPDCGLQVSALPKGRVVRLAFDAPHTYGRRGAHWYEDHHALARLLSEQLPVTVHAYVLDPDQFELVVSYGAGRRVGGERVDYAQLELDGDGLADDQAFEREQERWPLGYLAHLYGVRRPELLRLPRESSVLLPLYRPELLAGALGGPLDALFA